MYSTTSSRDFLSNLHVGLVFTGSIVNFIQCLPPNYSYTVDVERFARLNIRGFSPMKFFAEILSRCSVHYLPKAKNSRENFRGKLENREKLAHESFPVYGISNSLFCF